MSTPESHPEKFPPAVGESLDPEALKKLDKLAAPQPDAPLPEDREERRKVVEAMFKGALACFFGAPREQTIAEFEREIDEHNLRVTQKQNETKENNQSSDRQTDR